MIRRWRSTSGVGNFGIMFNQESDFSYPNLKRQVPTWPRRKIYLMCPRAAMRIDVKFRETKKIFRAF
ncbi:hypothetical protein MFFC18_16430 [Mariniblastus fucicola]|uniref:Uncharacterized protein n=1 Tax=Mariniblastus fucicola TaxID=980251 RepID=A0A5B9P686_9BACT|nr:hypothetical protein MFFC18_16430 [Mariniblastus fucicola]